MKQKVSLGEMQFSSAGVGSLHCPWHPGLLKGGFSCVPCDRLPGTLCLLWLGVSAHTCSLLPCRLALCSCYSLPVGATLGRLELLGDGREFKQLKMWFFSILYKSSALITSPSKKKNPDNCFWYCWGKKWNRANFGKQVWAATALDPYRGPLRSMKRHHSFPCRADSAECPSRRMMKVSLVLHCSSHACPQVTPPWTLCTSSGSVHGAALWTLTLLESM